MVNKISIIIPTMNRPNTLINTIESVMSSHRKPDEIVIVDQSCDLNMVEETRKKVINIAGNERVKYLYLKTPSSTAARNMGIDNCTNDVLIFMDDDINVKSDTFSSILEIMKDNSISMIGGLNELDMAVGQGNKLGYLFGRKSLLKRNQGHVVKAVFGRYPSCINKRVETQWAMGYFFVVRRSLIKKWNIRWDERLVSYAYAEDLDFTYSYYKKSKAENKKCILDPKIIVKHLCSTEYREPSFKKTVMYVVNREYLSYKHFNKSILSRILVRWSNTGEFLFRLKKKESPMDVIKAQYYCDKYRRDIKRGNLHYELYNL